MVVSGRKLYWVITLGCLQFRVPTFQNNWERLKAITEKQEYATSVFDKIDFVLLL